ncbi:MAG: competence/damage-inducible protein A [Chloroflexi bacterium]|nr:competence/damage-inducible protein A [Chloroflexota bacterium]
MTQDINAEVIAIGTEILLGEITDTNSVFIARTLRDIGVNLYYMTSVGDNQGRIASAIQLALGRAQVVITCGGLGPTVDDVTRQSVADATAHELVFHQELLDTIAERFAGFRVKMTENNRRQAFVPAGAVIVENPVGTAPAFIVEVEAHVETHDTPLKGQVVISLPGVPREMKYLLIEAIVPYLRDKYDLGGKIIKARTLRTAGIGESALDELIGPELLQASNPTVGLAAHSGQVDIRITAKGENEMIVNEMIASVEAQLREQIGRFIYGVDDDVIEQALIDSLREQDATLGVSEVGIEPVISERLKTVAGGEAVLHIVDPHAAAQVLCDVLEMPEKTPPRQLAERCAQRLTQEFGATVGIAVISRPDLREDRADKDEVSVIAVYANGKMRSRVYGFGGATDTAKIWTGNWALSMAWRMLHDSEL